MNEIDDVKRFPHILSHVGGASERPKFLSGCCVELFGLSGQSKKNAEIVVRT